MSKQLGVVDGLKEELILSPGEITEGATVHRLARMSVVSFAGAQKQPKIQLSLNSDHIQLNQGQVAQLINLLEAWLH